MVKYNSRRDFVQKEADIISRYILGQEAPESTRRMYGETILCDQHYQLSVGEHQLMRLALLHPLLLEVVESGLKICNPKSSICKRIVLMCALLECEPQLSHYFLSKNYSYSEVFFVGLGVVRGLVFTILGAPLIAPFLLFRTKV